MTVDTDKVVHLEGFWRTSWGGGGSRGWGWGWGGGGGRELTQLVGLGPPHGIFTYWPQKGVGRGRQAQ
jgi:hypothetical protein